MKIHSINTYIEPKPMNNSLPNFKGKLLSQKIINPQKHLMQDAFIQLFNKIKSKGNKIIQIPSVSIPLVSYMGINKNKVLYEMDKSYQPYTNKVYETKEEFIKRGLPFKEEYVSDYTGGLSLTGENIIKNYDKSKALFEQEGLYFSNDLIDVHTGNLNYNGISIQNTYLRTCEKLKKAGQPIKDCYYDHKTGALSKEGLQVTQNSVSFGSSTDDQQFASADPADTDIPVMQDDNSIPIHRDYEVHDSLVFSKDEMKLLNEMNNIDIRMDPVLQEIHDAPPLDTVEGLMTSIFGEIPAGVNFDWDLWSALKGIANDIIDIGDWI